MSAETPGSSPGTDPGNDPSILQDFLTEAAELIQQLDVDLVKLESASNENESRELLNGIFRALHTVKGAAGFLGLETVIRFSHAAEDALNRLRKGEVAVSAPVIDALLQSVDQLRAMTAALAAGDEVPECPEALMHRLHEIADCKTPQAQKPVESRETEPAVESPIATKQSETAPVAATKAPAEQAAVAAVASAGGVAPAIRPLALGTQKLDLLPFMVADLKEAVTAMDQIIARARKPAERADSSADLIELSEAMFKTLDFFELAELSRLVLAIGKAAPSLGSVSESHANELLLRVEATGLMIAQQAALLDKQQALVWHVDTMVTHLTLLATGEALPEHAHAHENKASRLLEIEVIAAASPATTVAKPEAVESPAAAPIVVKPATPSAEAPAKQAATKDEPAPIKVAEPLATAPTAPASEPAKETKKKEERASEGVANASGDQTIRVEVSRLEDLLNLVGQLVLIKNRVLGLSRRMRSHGLPHEMQENVTGAANELDRLTGTLQLGVMRTRMQPMSKLFDRYPRVIRDVARLTSKKIDLQIDGKETEVDKTVLELLADPLVHILRNSADHGIESPEQRVKAGKPETGTVKLLAEYQGDHVRVVISDDGKGLDREMIGRKAVERGLASAEQVAGMDESQVFQFIFAAGFSTAEKVSDLSGRGVGMDVVRTNVSKLNGTVNLSSVKGKGTNIEILIPLTVAIMRAMVVGVGKYLYAVPLTSITEIVRTSEAVVHTVAGSPVMTLRDSVLPLIDMRERLGERAAAAGATPDETREGRIASKPSGFAVVVAVGSQRAGLVVDHLVGQQEVVVKSLDDQCTTGGPFSGATIREDGGVSLILDVVQLLQDSKPARKAAA